MTDCPFDNLQRCEAWQGCETQFHEGVALMGKVLPNKFVDRVKQEGNTSENAKLISESVKTLKERSENHIEDLRKRLAAYDKEKAIKAKAPVKTKIKTTTTGKGA